MTVGGTRTIAAAMSAVETIRVQSGAPANANSVQASAAATSHAAVLARP
jgi:hypothetical protein